MSGGSWGRGVPGPLREASNSLKLASGGSSGAGGNPRVEELQRRVVRLDPLDPLVRAVVKEVQRPTEGVGGQAERLQEARVAGIVVVDVGGGGVEPSPPPGAGGVVG